MADTPLDLTLDAAELTARLVDFPSESGAEKPLADAIEDALRGLPHLTVDRTATTWWRGRTWGGPSG